LKAAPVTPREAPLIVAELPVTKAATTVEELQEWNGANWVGVWC
jgi:hypothetical protein